MSALVRVYIDMAADVHEKLKELAFLAGMSKKAYLEHLVSTGKHPTPTKKRSGSTVVSKKAKATKAARRSRKR